MRVGYLAYFPSFFIFAAIGSWKELAPFQCLLVVLNGGSHGSRSQKDEENGLGLHLRVLLREI